MLNFKKNKMKQKMTNVMLAGILLVGLIAGCKKDNDQVPVPQPVINEQEVITTMMLSFVDSANTSNIRYATFRDPDGDGGASYDIFDTIILQPNKTWYTSITLLNETVSPADTISNEVLEEANDHLFCFSPSGTSAIVTITDLDGNSLPIGLQSKWKTTSTGVGTMQIELKHQAGVKNGSCSPGETDININFQVKVQ